MRREGGSRKASQEPAPEGEEEMPEYREEVPERVQQEQEVLRPPSTSPDSPGGKAPVRETPRVQVTAQSEEPAERSGSTGTALEGMNRLRERFHAAGAFLTGAESLLRERRLMQSGAAAQLRILLAEIRIKLAGAEIAFEEACTSYPNDPEVFADVEVKVSEAEGKLAEAERLLLGGEVAGTELQAIRGRLKIELGRLKIELAEARIGLAGFSLPHEGGAAPIPEQRAAPGHHEAAPAATPPISRPVPSEPTPKMRPLPQERISEPEEELKSVGVPRERVRIPGEETESPVLAPPPASPAPPPIIEPLDDESPFETGIASERSRIVVEGPAGGVEIPAGPRERVKIPEAEGTEGGAVPAADRKVTIPAGTKEPEAVANPDERRISVRATEVERTLLVEDLNRQGIALRKAGRSEEALACFDRALELEPSSTATLHNRGVALRSLGRFEEALASFDRVLASEPENHVVWFNRGLTLGRAGRFEEALDAFEHVLDLDPRHAAASYNKGRILEKLGRQEEAAAWLAKATELGYRG